MAKPMEVRLYAYELLEWIKERFDTSTGNTLNPMQTMIDLQKKLRQDATGKE